MANFLHDVEVGQQWKLVQISGTGDATNVNRISFAKPVQIRRAIVNLSIPNDPVSIKRSLDGSTNVEQIEILQQNCVDEAAQSLIHPDGFSLHSPQTTATPTYSPGGFVYLETTGFAGTWTLTVEARE